MSLILAKTFHQFLFTNLDFLNFFSDADDAVHDMDGRDMQGGRVRVVSTEKAYSFPIVKKVFSRVIFITLKGLFVLDGLY